MQKNIKKRLAVGALCATAALGAMLPVESSYATSGGISGVDIDTLTTWMNNTGGFTDVNFFDCVVGQYMLNRGIVAIERHMEENDNKFSDATLESMTQLGFCANNNIKSIEGIHKMPNLTYLNLQGNDIKEMDLSGNTKIKTLAVQNNPLVFLDLSNNPLLKSLSASDITVRTAARANYSEGGIYNFDLGSFGFLFNSDGDTTDWSIVVNDSYVYDANTHVIYTSNREALLYGVGAVSSDGSMITLDPNPVNAGSDIYVDGQSYRTYADIRWFVGEPWDSDAKLDSIYELIENDDYAYALSDLKAALKNATLVEVKAFRWTNDGWLEMTKDTGLSAESTTTHLSGQIPMDAKYGPKIEYYFETIEADPTDPAVGIKAPDTGLFTSIDDKIKTALPFIVLVSASLLALGIVAHLVKVQKQKVHFKKH